MASLDVRWARPREWILWPTFLPTYLRQPATTPRWHSFVGAGFFVVFGCLDLLYGIAFDSRWRYQEIV
jgi:hypothetical protein